MPSLFLFFRHHNVEKKVRPALRRKQACFKQVLHKRTYTLFKRPNIWTPPIQHPPKENKAQLDPRDVFKLKFHIATHTGRIPCSFHITEVTETYSVLHDWFQPSPLWDGCNTGAKPQIQAELHRPSATNCSFSLSPKEISRQPRKHIFS